MSYCININHPEYIQLLQNSNLKPAVLKAKIGVWMEENNSTDFPTLEQLNGSVTTTEEKETDTILYQTDRAKSYQQRAKTIYFNEVRGKQLSNSDISNINAKLRKLSDEIGDVNWNLRQSSNTNNYYIAGYKNAPVTMDDYYSPYAGGMFRQLTTQSLESRVEELDKKLMSWARKHGISVEALKAVMEKFPDRYDGTALGIADFAKKLIAVADGARIDTLPEEIAHFAIELLIKDPTVVQALEEVVNTPEYAEVKEDYKDIYEEEIDFRKEALGKILAQEIVTNFKKSQENPNNGFWSKILDIANKFFNWVGTNFSKKSAPRTAIEAVVIPLANSILNQEYLGTLDNIDLNIEEEPQILYQTNPNAQPVNNNILNAEKTFLSSEEVISILNKVSKQSGVSISLVDFKTDSNSIIYGGYSKENKTIELNKNFISLDTLLHELAHPFVTYINAENFELFNKLLNEAKQKYPEIEQKLRKNPAYSNLPQSWFNEEIIVRALEKEYNENTFKEPDSLYEKFVDFIKNLFGLNNLDISKIETISDLYEQVRLNKVPTLTTSITDKIAKREIESTIKIAEKKITELDNQLKALEKQLNSIINTPVGTLMPVPINEYVDIEIELTEEDKQKSIKRINNSILSIKQIIKETKQEKKNVLNSLQKEFNKYYSQESVTNSNVEQKKKFLEGVVVQLNNRVKRFKNSAKSQTEIVALNIEITKLQKLIAQSEFDLGINSFAQLASKELDAILSYLNKSLKNKNLNGDKLALAQEFEQTYTSLFLELKKGMYEYEFEETEIDALLAIIDNVENKLKQAEAITTVMRKMLAEKVTEAGNLNAYGEKIDPNFNAKEIVEATDDDMSWWRLWLGNYKFSNSGIIRTAHKIIFDSIAVVKRFTVQTGNEILAAQEKFIKAGYKVEDIIQKDKDGKPTQYFVREHNYHSYYNAIQETKNNIAKALGRDDYSLVQASLLEPADKAIYNKFWNDFFKNNTKTILQKRDDGTAVEMKVPADKYLEKDFLKKMEDPNFSAYYNLIIEKKREAVNKLPVQYRTDNLVYSLPAIRKSFLERITSKDQSYLSKIKGITKESFFVDEDDTIFGDLDSLNNKMVPIHFTRKFDNIADQSFDVARTVTLFAEMAENYREMNRISGDLTAVQSTLAERKYGKKKGIQSSDYQALETMLDTHVFGIEKKNVNFTIPENNFTKKIGIDNKQFSWTKAFQNLASFIRTNNLAFNPATSIAGWLKGSGDSIIEDQIGIYTTNESKNWSRMEFMTNIGHVMGEIGKPKQTNKMHLILQENEIVDINRMLFETTKNRVTRKTLNRDIFYVTFATGDYGLKGRATLAVYDNHRLYNNQFITRAKFYEKTAKEKGVTNDKAHQKEVGKQWEALREKSLYNAYEVVDGQLKIKTEFAPFIPDALVNSIKGKVEHLTNYLDGTLSPTDKGKLARGIAGDFLLMHRGWFIGMMDTRFKRNDINMISEEEEVGTYRATGAFLVEAFSQSLIKDKNLKGAIVAWNNLSDPYKRGVMKTALDLLYLNIVAIVAALFNAAADDDDDNLTLQYTAYQLNRLLLEQGAAWSPAELLQMIDEPVVGARFIKDVVDLKEAVNFGEVYESGMYEDKSHAQKWWLKKLPTRNLYELRFPELKNKFIKNLIDSQYYEYLTDEQKHSIVSKKSFFDWLIPFNEGYSEELQQNNVRQVVDYLEADDQGEYNEFN